MAGRAGHVGVSAGQRKSSRAMIKFCGEPGVHAMALLAGSRESGGHMIGVGGLLEIFCVAGITLRGQSLELPGGGTGVTCVTR